MPLPTSQRLFFTAAYAYPGYSVRDLGILAGLDPCAAYKAAARLERRGLLTSHRIGARRYCSPVGLDHMPRPLPSKAGGAISPLQANALLTAADAPGPLTAQMLTGKNLQGRRPQIDALVRAGFLIVSEPAGGRITYRITPAGRELADYLYRLAGAKEKAA